MNACFIGKHKYPEVIFSNELDLKTWRSMSAYFDGLFVIAESSNLFFNSAQEDNIQIYLVPRLGYFGFIFFSVVLGFYLNLKYTIDVFDASEVVGGGVAVTLLKYITKKPTVIEVQGEIFRKPENKQSMKSLLIKLIGRYVMRRAARVRVISHAIFNQVKEQSIGESKIRLIPLRIDLNLFSPVSDTGEKVDNMWITLGYIGRLVDGKGIEDLFEAVKILKNRNSFFARVSNADREIKNWKLVIYGMGVSETKLKKLADKLNISDKIEWRGFVSYGNVPQAFSEIDIFIYPSWHEGFGRSIMEALAMEKAVVATNVGGIPDLINNGKNGFLVKSHDPNELAGKIKELIENRELRENFGKSGREWVSKNFEWDIGIKKFADLFLELK